jgi:hypothetical protein
MRRINSFNKRRKFFSSELCVKSCVKCGRKEGKIIAKCGGIFRGSVSVVFRCFVCHFDVSILCH